MTDRSDVEVAAHDPDARIAARTVILGTFAVPSLGAFSRTARRQPPSGPGGRPGST